jgi:hypothetical protein
MDRRSSSLFDSQNRGSYNETNQSCKHKPDLNMFSNQKKPKYMRWNRAVNAVWSKTFTGKKSTISRVNH